MMRWVYAVAALLIGGGLAADVWLDIDYRRLANVSLLAVTAGAATFSALYWARSKWWTNRIGKVYLAQSVFIAAVFVQIVAGTWWDVDFPGRQHIRFVIYTLGAVAYVPMLATLWGEQQRDRRRRRGEVTERDRAS